MTAQLNSLTVRSLAAALLALSAQSAFAADGCVADIAKVIADGAIPANAKPLPPELAAKLDAAVKSALPQTSAPGVIVGVVTPSGTWKAAYGIADPAKGTPMAVGMHTRIGSVTKTFTGTAIMQLAEAGKLSLNDKISKYVAGIPNGDRITLRQLANMTSGLASYTRSKKFQDVLFSKPETIFTPRQLLDLGLAEPPLFQPGASFDYSNTNTILLGMVIEKVTGKPVGEVFKEQIFDPLKLRNTSWPGASVDMPTPFAQGFTLQGDFAKPDAPSNATHWNPSWGWTAGELISDIDDLLVYARALGTGHGLLGAAAQRERLTFPAAGGYGIGVGCVAGWVGHTGELPGYNTTLYYNTAAGIAVAVQANSDIASGDCKDEPTLTNNPRDPVCSAPAKRVFAAVAKALGYPFLGP
ncbi:MAG: serine hydrolase domain-containing protein [Sphingomicrobium sp.]